MKKTARIHIALALVCGGLWGCQQPTAARLPTPPAPTATVTPRPAASSSAVPVASPAPTTNPSSVTPLPSGAPSPSVEPSSPSGAPVIQARYVGQLFYQWDCLAGQGNCSQSAYAQQWQSLGVQTTGNPLLNRWLTLKNTLDRTRVLSTQISPLAEPLVFQSQNTWDQVRVAALTSDTLNAFSANITPLMGTAERDEMVSILQSLSDTFFEDWWQQEGKSQAESLTQRYQETFDAYALDDFINQVSNFYEISAEQRQALQFHLLLQAPGAEDLSFAEQILAHGILEVSSSQSPHSQLDVMLHEMTHYFFKQLPATTQAQIQNFFAQQTEPEAMSAYHLFDESLATAIGNGYINQKVLRPDFFARMQTTPLSFFNDPWIDTNGKALFNADLLFKGQTITADSFLSAYYQSTRTALDLTHPVPRLRLSAVFAATPALQRLLPELQGRLKPWAQFVVGQTGPAFFERYPRLNGVILLAEDLSPLQAWQGVLGDTAYNEILSQAPAGAFLYGVSTPQRQLYILRSLSSADDSPLLQSLLQQRENANGWLKR